MLKRLLFIALLMPTALLAAGPTSTVSWIAPTQYTDGSSLGSSDIASYTVSWSRTVGGPVVNSVVVTAPATSKVVNGLICGSFVFTVTVTTSSTALYPSSTSDPSNTAMYATGVACRPNPPTGLTAS